MHKYKNSENVVVWNMNWIEDSNTNYILTIAGLHVDVS